MYTLYVYMCIYTYVCIYIYIYICIQSLSLYYIYIYICMHMYAPATGIGVRLPLGRRLGRGLDCEHFAAGCPGGPPDR